MLDECPNICALSGQQSDATKDPMSAMGKATAGAADSSTSVYFISPKSKICCSITLSHCTVTFTKCGLWQVHGNTQGRLDRMDSNKRRWWVMITLKNSELRTHQTAWLGIFILFMKYNLSFYPSTWAKLPVMELSPINPSELYVWGPRPWWTRSLTHTHTHTSGGGFLILHFEKAWNQVRHDDKHGARQSSEGLSWDLGPNQAFLLQLWLPSSHL